MWKENKIDLLLREGMAIQERLNKNRSKNENHLPMTFSRLVTMGKVSQAIKLLENSDSKGILDIDEKTIDLLKKKHPKALQADQTLLLNGPVKKVEPIIFESITASKIKDLLGKMKGSSGPSGLDVDQWKQLLLSRNFAQNGNDLANAIANMTKMLATEHINERDSLQPYTACRLIPLDKNPGLRPIGIGEVLRRLTGKAILDILKPDIQQYAGCKQLCAGQMGGIEAGIHAANILFEDDKSQGIIQIDASNAFNSLNRQMMLHNLQIICPEIAIYGWNCYITPARLFVHGGFELDSEEGTTKGCPFAMPSYALAIMPLLSMINSNCDGMRNIVNQVAFADDITGIGDLKRLKEWWLKVNDIGPKFGYYPEPTKSWLIVKKNNFIWLRIFLMTLE